MLTSEIDSYRRELTPVISKICDLWLRLSGYNCKFNVEWSEITLQDITDLSRSKLYDAQAEKLISETGGEQNNN